MTTPREACFQVPAFHRTLLAEYATMTSEVARVGSAGDAKVAGFSDGFVPELHHRLYAESPNEIPAEQRSPAAAVRARLHNLASELPEFDTLRKQTLRDPVWSGMAATAISESVVGALPARSPNDPPSDADQADRVLDGLRDLLADGAVTESNVAHAAGEAFKAAEGVVAEAAKLDESAVRQSLRRAIASAQEQIADAKNVSAILGGAGSGAGTGGASSPAVAVELARKVRNSAKLQKIVALAGRLQATARAKRATRSEYARSELVGTEQTGDVGRLLPSELAALGDPARATDLLRRVVERNALGYKLRGREKTAKGPIVIVIDQSGSMAEGDKDAWSKAIALALLDAARTEHRSFGVVLYNGAVAHAVMYASTDKVSPGELLDLLSTAPAGGTDYAPALRQALDWIEAGGKLGKADVVHITDGEPSTRSAPTDTLTRANKLGARIIGIGIATAGAKLQTWSHEVACIDDVSRDTAAVDLIFDKI